METTDFGKFTLLEAMGKGSVGIVYRATDTVAGNIVAIKIFQADPERPADVVRRLRDREVHMLISIQHPNVVKYYECGQVDGAYYYIMEFVEDSLLKRMRNPSEFTLPEKIHILRQTVNALQGTHNQGIVHRDIKPGNILLDESPSGAIHVKVTDLGIAKHVSETDVERGDFPRRVPGTPKYLAPEQIRLKPVDGRADIFSLGVVAYELLSGRPPFKASSSEEYLKANLRQEPRPLHHVNPDVPVFFSELVGKMLAKEREGRYDSDTLARDLELTYQHLVSNAPLVEQSNPQSIFYVPAAPAVPAPAPRPTRRIEVVSWVAAVGIVLLGVLVGFTFWPAASSEADGHGLQPAPTPTSAELLAWASELRRQGHGWAALAVTRAVAPRDLAPEQKQELARLSSDLQQSLGPRAYQGGDSMLRAERIAEAEVVLRRMKTLLPDAVSTRQLAARIDALRRAQHDRARWQSLIQASTQMLNREEYAEAIRMAEELLKEYASDSDKATVLQDVIVQGLDNWSVALLTGKTDAQEVQEYLDLFASVRQNPWAARAADRSCTLYLRLAMSHEQARRYDEALAQYKRVEKECEDDMAAEARRAIFRLARSGRLSSMAVEPLDRELRTNGFKSGIWVADMPESGGQTVAQDGTLQMTLKASRDQSPNVRATERPVSNKGFTVSAEFRMRLPGEPAVRRSLAGLEVEDRASNRIALAFDGTSYVVRRRHKSRTTGTFIEGGSSVRTAFGDEHAAWHQLTLRYDFELSRVEILVDTEELGTYKMDLGDFSLRVFLQNTGQGECNAEFRNILCRP